MIPRISRTKAIIDIARGKSVLDIGCIGVYEQNKLHKEMSRVAKRLVGIDIKVKETELLQKEGYDVRLISADDAPFDLGEKFDLVVAGALLEHIYNLRIFIDNVRRHLNPNGMFVGTIHNPQAFEFFLECWVYKKALHRVRFHTHWQSERTMKYLFEQCGLELKSVKYIHQFAKSRIGKTYDILFWWLPNWFSRTILFTAQLADGGKTK